MNPRDFLDLARLLAIGTPGPANLRTATSRAYYAAHHIGAEVLSGMGFTITKSPTGHRDVWNRLQNSGHEDLEAAGTQLSNLHSNRIKADYRMDDTRAENQQNVRGHVGQAERIIEAIVRSCSGPTRQNILSAIKAWERGLKNKGV